VRLKESHIKVKNKFYSPLQRKNPLFRDKRYRWVIEKVSTRKENKRGTIRKNYDDRSLCVLTDVHLAAIVNDHRAEILRGSTLRFSRLACLAQQLHAVHKVKPRGGPRWSLPPRFAGGYNTYRTLSSYIENTFTSAKADRHRRSNANQRYPDGLHRQKSDSQSHIWMLGRNNASLRLA